VSRPPAPRRAKPSHSTLESAVPRGGRTQPDARLPVWRAWLPGVALVVLVLAVYAPTLGNGFIWDDDYYVQDNAALRDAVGLRDIWFRIGTVPQYYPLVHSTFWIEYHLWGLDPRGYHLVNLACHACSALLVWRLLRLLRVPGAWLAAAIFAVHPVQVESVAWVTERKNVLSCALALGALLAYFRFSPLDQEWTAKQPARPPWKYYALALLLFVGALLSKTVTASLPAVVLVLIWWKRGRVTRQDVWRLAPFFVVGIALAGITVWMEKTHVGAQGEEWNLSPVERILIAGRAAWFYAGKLVWPHPLAFFYPRWTIDTHAAWQYLFPLSAGLLLTGLWLARRRIGRGPLASVLIFGGVLVPALGFFDVYPFRYSFVADHFQYHASIALIALLTAVGCWVFAKALGDKAPGSTPEPAGWLAFAAGAIVLVTLGVLARQQTYAYENLTTLYEDTLAKNPESWAAHNNLAGVLLEQGKTQEATEHYRAAMRLLPREAWPRTLGSALYLSDQPEVAEKVLRDYLAGTLTSAERADAFVHLANVLQAAGRTDDALEAYRQGLEIQPDHWKGLSNYALALGKAGQTSAAIEALRRAIAVQPNNADAHNNLGLLLIESGQLPEAIAAFETALRLRDTNARFHENLAMAYFKAKNLPNAEQQLRRALQLNSQSADAHNLLGIVYGEQGNLPAAIEEFTAALRIDPRHAGAQANLAAARAASQTP